MNQFIEWLSRVFGSWKFWIVIPPWDVGVRIRLGKTATALQPGLHLRVPWIDEIALVNTRLRIVSTAPVTIGGSTANRSRTVSAAVGFMVAAPLKAMLAYTYPDMAVASLAQAEVAKGVPQDECLSLLRQEFERNGITITTLWFSEDVEVRTIRLLQGGGGAYSGGNSPMPMGASGPVQY